MCIYGPANATRLPLEKVTGKGSICSIYGMAGGGGGRGGCVDLGVAKDQPIS